ncbi:MAG: HypC/HybG/HupF family hydrogenase formation chaperone [Acidimicrobiales bacterium]|jgi:hydrogenase maturation factor
MSSANEVTMPDMGTTDDVGVAECLAAAALSLARRFAAGATMWCAAPQWRSHGRHVAVEFVHPVIVGKRALPAVDLEGHDVAAVLRLLSSPGDVLLVVSSADDVAALDLLRRAEAWGLTRIWLGAGPRPAASAAEHVVWWGSLSASFAAQSGDIVLLYHLLWELSHVVFEHPGLLAAATEAETGCTDDVCITCSDEGRVAEVRAVHDDGRAEVLVAGRIETVDATLVDAGPGDLLLVHAGVAITLLGDPGPGTCAPNAEEL